jgi:hypothetical protein
MILVDANLLIYAIDRDSPHHAHARPWLEERLSGTAMNRLRSGSNCASRESPGGRSGAL